MTTWDVLVMTIPHRHECLDGLLADFDRQHQPGFGVIAYRDNLQAKLAVKMQTLLEASQAEYVSHVDDDDRVAPDYVAAIMDCLQRKPDYVGFPVHYTVDGFPQQKVEHSLRHPGWVGRGDVLLRDISHLNPIRRELALQARFDCYPDHGADGMWAAALRETGTVRTEEWIDRPMYHYDFRTDHSFLTHREPWRHALPERPQYPWLTWLGE